MNKCYVGNLPWSATEDQIKGFLADCGQIEDINMIIDRETGRFRGFCFVQFQDEAGMKAAISLNGKEMGGRAVKINEAQDKKHQQQQQRPRQGGGRRW